MKIKNVIIGLALFACQSAWAIDHTVQPKYVWTNNAHSIRPSSSYTDLLKHLWVPYGHSVSEYELDHNAPICLGGAPKDTHNLWLQKWADARRKDVLENFLCSQVRNRKMTLQDARRTMESWK